MQEQAQHEFAPSLVAGYTPEIRSVGGASKYTLPGKIAVESIASQTAEITVTAHEGFAPLVVQIAKSERVGLR